MSEISIIMPVYNEEKLIEKALKEVFDLSLDKEIIVIDDFSDDGTKEKLKGLQKKFNFKFIELSKNAGKGNAIKEGLLQASGAWAIVFDADLEYRTEDISRLLNEAKKHENEKIAVYGSRFLGEYKNKLSFHYAANRFLTLIANLFFDLNLTDMETCLKLCPTEILKKLNLKSKRFEFEPEITARLAKNKIKIIEIPISYSRRTYQEGKKIRFKDGVAALKTLFQEKFFRED